MRKNADRDDRVFARWRAGERQCDLAEELGVTRSVIQRIVAVGCRRDDKKEAVAGLDWRNYPVKHGQGFGLDFRIMNTLIWDFYPSNSEVTMGDVADAFLKNPDFISDLLRTPNFGPASLRILEKWFAERGVSIAKKEKKLNDQTTEISKITGALLDVTMAANLAEGYNLGGTKLALADCTRALKRIASRAAPLPAEYERVEIVQAHGPTIEFCGKLLCETSFQTRGRQALELVLEVWETKGGALVAVSSSTLPDGTGREDCRVTVVEPQDDVQVMHFAVMSAFSWHDRARSMVRKLGWSLKMDVL